jgi:outer membrane protein assembly factor BamB
MVANFNEERVVNLYSRLLTLVGVCLLPVLVLAESDGSAHWPSWRGPNLNGLVDAGDPPVEWSETSNIRWKMPIPGQGHATPIVWGNRIYLQTAVEVDPAKHQYKLLALDR